MGRIKHVRILIAERPGKPWETNRKTNRTPFFQKNIALDRKIQATKKQQEENADPDHAKRFLCQGELLKVKVLCHG